MDTVPGRGGRGDGGRLTLLTADGEVRAALGARVHEDSGATVGDWVALRGELAVAVLPRRTAFTRVVAGRGAAQQTVAANLDTVLVVDALAEVPRLRRVE